MGKSPDCEWTDQQALVKWQEWCADNDGTHENGWKQACVRGRALLTMEAEVARLRAVVEAADALADEASAEREWARAHNGDPNYAPAFEGAHRIGRFDSLLNAYRASAQGVR